VSATATYEPASKRSGRQIDEPVTLQILEWGTAVPVVVALIWLSLARDSWRSVSIGEAAFWVAIVAASDLMPVRLWHDLILALSLPIVLAAAFVYPPEVAAGIAFLGSVDLREIRREVSVGHGLFNRSQVAVSTAAASAVFHSLHTDLSVWPHVLGVALLALTADVLVNWTLVYVGLRTMEHAGIGSVLKNMSAGDPLAFLSAYVSFGLVAVLLALAVEVGGTWGLVAVGIPILLARQVFVRSMELRDTALLLAEKSRLLLAITEKIGDERRDERLAIAASLHDDLLPPLYKVHLLGQVIRQDLATGQLLALDDDVPDLVSATEHASDTARSLIRRLRSSPLGTDGLVNTLQLLARNLASQSVPRIHTQLRDAGGAPVIQLLAYQIAREALRNAMRHSSAENVWLRLDREGHEIRLIIEDDGMGFDPTLVDEDAHFGLQLMRERVELVGGIFRVDTAPNSGTRIVVRLPRQLDR
jgi:signal transduction histidine kinase